LDRSGLTLGQDYFLAYSPEREDPGNRDFGTKNIPKVVGGMNQESTRLATELYRSSVDSIVAVENCEIAEACKILENTYRSVNIAMVNELKLLFDRLDIDIWKVIEAAKTKPFGFQAFYPGPGLGGHCIPIDPFYLTWLARRHEMSTRFIELAGEINTSMPDYVVSKVTDALNSCCKSVRGSRIGVLGIAYKKDIDDHRESPSFKIIEQLHAKGAELSYSDPHVSSIRKTRSVDVPVLPNCPLTAEYLSSLDACVIATDHTAFDYPLIAKHAKLIIDTRNAMHRIDCRVGQVWKA
jgi:UDP-N-acetyl-D-glucosamine dehydrogenase